MPSETVELVYDHYKDTNRLIDLAIAKRDRYFVVGLLLVIATSLLAIEPNLTIKMLGDLGKGKFAVSEVPAYHIVNTLLLYLSTWFWLRYYQTVIHLEGLYPYVHDLERSLVENFRLPISREGAAYKKHSSILRLFIQKFYTILVPLLLLVVSSVRISLEWLVEMPIIPLSSRLLDTLAVASLIVTTTVYLSWIHFRDFKEQPS